MSSTLYLVDASGFIFRAYHAIQQKLTTSTGLPTNAVLGFTNMLLKLVREQKPDLLAVVFDAAGRSFRDDLFSDYKANRKAMPPDLAPQFDYAHRIVRGFRMPLLAVENVEADDVIATLARRARAEGVEVVIVSSDKDLMQLVGDGVSMVDTLADRRYGPREVEEKWGVPPDKVGDLLALMGDSSDNVPGVPGVGAKTAAALVKEHGSLDAVLAAAVDGRIARAKLREALVAHAADARLSRELVSLREDCDLGVDVDALAPGTPDRVTLEPLFRELEFGRLLGELGAAAAPQARERYRTICAEVELGDVLARARAAGEIGLAIRTSAADPMRADIVGIALAWGPASEETAAYLPVGHAYLGCPAQIPLARALDRLRPLLEDPSVAKVGHDHKVARILLAQAGVTLAGVKFDPMIASYLLDASRASHSIDALARDILGITTIAAKDVVGSGRAQIAFSEVDLARATASAAEEADVALRLSRALAPRIDGEGLGPLLRDVELPLARVLSVVEAHGIRLDAERLARLGRDAEQKLAALEAEIHALAGGPININSPIQLRELLFDKLGLPPGRKTKTGLSTDADVLETLAALHPIPAKILEHRAIAKLKGTYIDTLPSLVNPRTGRLHTSFDQAVAATGRLSSRDPNLQNIPIRSDLGREIRRAFVAADGCVLLSADYSQIELRVLAHLSDDPILLDAFARGQDIHTRTAAEVFGVFPEAVSPEMRRIAKSVVYGLSYGQTDFGLAQNLGISKSDARKYIQAFFARYAKLREYLDGLVREAKTGAPSRTLLGRRRFIPDINSPVPAARGYAERIARNTPIQGTAADILKLAMIRTQETLEKERARTRMLLTVHDELVFEVPHEELDAMRARLPDVMSSVMTLKVPLHVDVGVGPTWADAH